jgi:hypothetical protein
MALLHWKDQSRVGARTTVEPSAWGDIVLEILPTDRFDGDGTRSPPHDA